MGTRRLARWLALTIPTPAVSRIWTLTRWGPLELPGVLEAGYPQGLARPGMGYLLQTNRRATGRSGESWFSADGIHWTESKPGLTG